MSAPCGLAHWHYATEMITSMRDLERDRRKSGLDNIQKFLLIAAALAILVVLLKGKKSKTYEKVTDKDVTD